MNGIVVGPMRCGRCRAKKMTAVCAGQANRTGDLQGGEHKVHDLVFALIQRTEINGRLLRRIGR